MRLILLLLLLLSNILFVSNESITCDNRTIDHCISCGTGDYSDTCSKCEPNYFPFMGYYFCLPCNDSTYGIIGCEGNCEPINITSSSHPYCEKEGCSEGFYYKDGVCKNCSEYYSSNCGKCIYEIQGNSTSESFKCLECKSNQYMLVDSRYCEKCKYDNCEQCHYNEYYNETICDKCNEDYFLNISGECEPCRKKYIPGGNCFICSKDGIEYDYCKCDSRYIKVGDSQCLKCPVDCQQCSYNNITNDTECQICDSYYRLSSDHKCIYCGSGCSSCILDENENPICQKCDSTYLLDKGRCIQCDEGCSNCTYDESSKYKNEAICTQCRSGYTFNLDKKKCIKCGSGCSECEPDKSSEYKNETKCLKCYSSYGLSPEGECVPCKDPDIGGEGCETCSYNEQSKKYKCNSCSSHYVYVNNIYQCFSHSNKSQLNLYGCVEAQYDEKNDKYECLRCLGNYEFKDNEKTCRIASDVGLSSDCYYFENLGTLNEPKYSCLYCKSGLTLAKNNSKGIKDCYARDEGFQYCYEGIIEEDGKYTCTKCVDRAALNSSGICECDPDSFGKDKEYCYKCDNSVFGDPGCDASKGCLYISQYNLQCNECKKGYHQISKGGCYYCAEHIDGCDECHYEIKLNESKRICDSCFNMYFLNKTQGTCELNELKEYPEISPGCIISKYNSEEYISNKKCEYCKDGYFLTKEGTCVYCRSEKYGGPGCYKCGYEEDKDGKESNNIICKDCYSFNNYNRTDYIHSYKDDLYNSALNSEGKCYNYFYNESEHCFKYEFLKGKDNKEELTCVLCIPGYYLNSENKCISLIDYIQIDHNCFEHRFSIGNISFFLIIIIVII